MHRYFQRARHWCANSWAHLKQEWSELAVRDRFKGVTAIAVITIALVELYVLWSVIGQNREIIKVSKRQADTISLIETTDQEEERRDLTTKMASFVNQQGYYDNTMVGASRFATLTNAMRGDAGQREKLSELVTEGALFDYWIAQEQGGDGVTSGDGFRPGNFRADIGLFTDKLLDIAECICMEQCDSRTANFMVGIEATVTMGGFGGHYCGTDVSRNMEVLGTFFVEMKEGEYDEGLCEDIGTASASRTVLCGSPY